MSAEQFYRAAEQIWTTEGVDLNAFVFPLIVNYALRAELSLKAAEGGAVGGGLTPDGLVKAAKIMSTAHGHNLSDVFASLELPTQAAIESAFLAMSGEQLAPLLTKCSNYFIQARYAYEQIGGSYDLTGVRTLAKGLLDAIKAFGTKNEFKKKTRTVQISYDLKYLEDQKKSQASVSVQRVKTDYFIADAGG